MFKTFFGPGLFNQFLLDAGFSQNVHIALFVSAVVVCIIAAYLLGSLNFAIIISGKKYRQDIRQYGSKNAGMTNMMRTYGKKAAALTLLGDVLKAIVACLIGYALIGQLGSHIAGLFCMIGHMFPIFYRFKGGKGVATAAATILMSNPIVFLILFVLFVLLVLMSKYLSLGSIMCLLLYPVVLNFIDTFLYGGCPYVIFAVLMAVLVVAKHWENIKRLSQGKENKFSFKKSVKAEEVAPKENSEK